MPWSATFYLCLWQAIFFLCLVFVKGIDFILFYPRHLVHAGVDYHSEGFIFSLPRLPRTKEPVLCAGSTTTTSWLLNGFQSIFSSVGAKLVLLQGRCDRLPVSDVYSEVFRSRGGKTGPSGWIFSFRPLEEGQEMRPNLGRGHRCRGWFTCWLSISSECEGAGAWGVARGPERLAWCVLRVWHACKRVVQMESRAARSQ